MFDWRTIVSLFAAPLGNLINKGITVGSTAVVVWAVSKGVPDGVIAPLVASVVLAISTVISGFASSQGIQIPIINADTTNGVKVVSEDSKSPAVNTKQ